MDSNPLNTPNNRFTSIDMIQRVLKIVIFAFIGLVAIGACGIFIANENLPSGTQEDAADAWAMEIQSKLNKKAFDSLKVVQWTFRGSNKYVWRKQDGWLEYSKGNLKVHLNLTDLTGYAYKNGQPLQGDKLEKKLQQAWSGFCNDSFWLVAPYKMFDEGTSRSIVQLEDGKKGLMVAYASGGVTPGDAYVWLVDDDNNITGWKMWVKIIPVGGLHFTWENWMEVGNGVQLSTYHKGVIKIEMTDVEVVF